MADETGSSGKPTSAVTAVTADDGGPDAGDGAAKVTQTRAQRDAEIRAAFLAADVDAEIADDVAARAKGQAAPKKKAPSPPPDDDDDSGEEVAETSDDDDEDLEGVELDDDELDDQEDELEDAEEDLDKAAAKEDSDLAKRLAKVQQREKRMRDDATARDRAFVAERDKFVAEWKPRVEKAVELERRFDDLKSKGDLLGILKLIDFPEEAYEEASQELWGLSKTGRADPKYRDASARLQEKRTLRAEAQEAKAMAKKLEERLNDRDAQVEARAAAEAFMGRVSKAIGDESPLLKKRLALKPRGTQAALAKIAMKLVQKAGAEVDPKLVVRAYEKRLRAERELAKQLADDDAGEAAAAAAAGKKKAPAITVIDKTKGGKAAPIVETKKPTNGSSGVHFPTRQEMVENLRKIERGELDPDAD